MVILRCCEDSEPSRAQMNNSANALLTIGASPVLALWQWCD